MTCPVCGDPMPATALRTCTIRRQVAALAEHWGASEQADLFGGESA